MECSQLLVWDVTCPDTYAPSHLALIGVEARRVAAEAEYHERTKYQELNSVYLFVPLAIETGCSFFFLLILENGS